MIARRKPALIGMPGLLAVCALSVLTGCAGGGLAGKSGSILITSAGTNAGVQLTSLQVNQTANVSFSGTGSDVNAGMDWRAICGGSPLSGSTSGNACGTFVPTHTPAGSATLYTAPALVPLGTTVSITGTPTGNPSAVSSLVLPIIAVPISLAFSDPPTSLSEGANTTFDVIVSNDGTNAGVSWTVNCSASSCGTLSASSSIGVEPETQYTAPLGIPPEGESVTITATSNTDKTKSVSTVISLVPITVSISPPGLYVQANGIAQLTATVANDAANGGINWMIICATKNGCGSFITPNPTKSGAANIFLAPASNPTGGIQITAASKTDPMAQATITINITSAAPPMVTISTKLPASLATGGTQMLAATVANDPSKLGIVWTCGPQGACGTFNGQSSVTVSSGTSVTYQAPASVPTDKNVVLTASSPAPQSNPASASVTIIASPLTPSISFVQEPSASVIVTQSTTVRASVTNDASTGGGVTWSVPCSLTAPGACGYVTPWKTANGATAQYVAPPVDPGVPVTVLATSTAFPTTSTTSTAISIVPTTQLSIRFTSLVPTQMLAATSANISAAVGNDPANAGIDYQVCGACGYFTVQPGIPEIDATPMTAYVPAVPPVTATTVQAWPNGLPIPYTAPITPIAVTIVASAHTNKNQTISAPITVNEVNGSPALTGTVLAGAEPVAGAAVQLYAAGTSGYGSASSLLYAPKGSPAAVTDANGNFTIQGGYGCPAANSQAYLVANGGHIGTSDVNPNRTMMTALGSCSNLSSTQVVINEITTVASAWPLAPFAANDMTTGNSSYRNIGTSSGNVAGLANAFAAVTNLVNVQTGQPLFTAVAGNANVPYVEVNTLADILNVCTATNGGSEGDGSPCGSLFTNTDGIPPGSQLHVVPVTDTLQAAFNIAQHPDGGFGYAIYPSQLLVGVNPGSPFQPTVGNDIPNDWSLALNFTGGGGLNSSSAVNYLSIDGGGDVWMSDATNNALIEWNNFGAAISPANGYSAGGLKMPGPVAVDANGYVWVASQSGLTAVNFNGAPLPWSPITKINGGNDIAIDAQGDIWVTNDAAVSEFTEAGLQLSPTGGYTNPGVTDLGAVAIDNSDNVWVGNGASSTNVFKLAELSNAGGQLIVNVNASVDTSQGQIAIDGTGDVWYPISNAGGQICEMPPYRGVGPAEVDTCTAGGQGGLQSLYGSRGVAVDGAGAIWVANTALVPSDIPNVTEIVPSLASTGYSASFANPDTAAPLKVAIDGSGDVWVLLKDGTITEYLGVATPVVTPLASAVNKEKLGAEP